MFQSVTFAQQNSDNLPVPNMYRTSVAALEKAGTSSITLAILQHKVRDVVEDAKLPKYGDLVLEKVAHIKRIAAQLGECVEDYPALHFGPGRLLDEMNALIQRKEQALLANKSRKMNRTNIPLCEDFLHGCCTRGVTCNESHTVDSLNTRVAKILEDDVGERGSVVLTILERYGPEAWAVLCDQIKTKAFESLVLRNADRDAISAVAGAIKANALATLKFLDVSHNQIGSFYPRGVLRMAKAIPASPTLTGLSLSHNSLGASGALCIAQSLGETITALNLSANGIALFDGAFVHFCDALQRAKNLKKLSLAQNGLGHEGVRRLLHSLTQGQIQLEFLDLFQTQCGDHGCAALVPFLGSEAGANFRAINVGWNKVTFEGVVQLCSVLDSHKKMEILRLHYNFGVGRKGAIALADLIKKNQCLAVIDLRWTSLNDDGVATLSESLVASRSLREVLLDGNDLDSRTLSLVSEKMTRKVPGPGAVQVEDEVW
jgi:hypothetical protein